MGDKIWLSMHRGIFLQCSITEQTEKGFFAGTDQRTGSGLGEIVGSLLG